MFITEKHLIGAGRFLKGMGVTLALPLAGRDGARRTGPGQRRHRTGTVRLVVHRDGARLGRHHRLRRDQEHCGRRQAGAAASISTPSALSPLEAYRDYLTIVSNTDVKNAEAFASPEIGGDHFRSAAVFLDAVAPEADPRLGRQGRHLDRPALRAAVRAGDRPSVAAAVRSRTCDQAGGCGYGYSCAYTDSISWALAGPSRCR